MHDWPIDDVFAQAELLTKETGQKPFSFDQLLIFATLGIRFLSQQERAAINRVMKRHSEIIDPWFYVEPIPQEQQD